MASGKTSRHRVKQASKQAAGFANQGTQGTREKETNNRPCTYKTIVSCTYKAKKVTHSPAHEEKHAGQETPLHYTPYLQWHHPGGRALLQLAQAPAQDYHS